MTAEAPSPRARLRRIPGNARYDAPTVHAILDAGIVAHVGVVDPDTGAPVVVPMAYARIGAHVYVHGSVASRLLRALGAGADACLTVTILDGILCARSAFNMSMAYRAVVVQGRAEPVDDPALRLAVFEAIMEQTVPGHWPHVRPPNDTELRQTVVARLPLTEASAKVETGPPDDDPADLSLAHWAGTIPLSTVAGAPLPAGDLPAAVPVPASIAAYGRFPAAAGDGMH